MFSIYKRLTYKADKKELKNKSRAQARRLKKKIKRCELCGSTGYLEVHHKDHNALNNRISNLIKICLPCHIKQHEKENVANLMRKKLGVPKPVDRGPVVRLAQRMVKKLL